MVREVAAKIGGVDKAVLLRAVAEMCRVTAFERGEVEVDVEVEEQSEHRDEINADTCQNNDGSGVALHCALVRTFICNNERTTVDQSSEEEVRRQHEQAWEDEWAWKSLELDFARLMIFLR